MNALETTELCALDQYCSTRINEANEAYKINNHEREFYNRLSIEIGDFMGKRMIIRRLLDSRLKNINANSLNF